MFPTYQLSGCRRLYNRGVSPKADGVKPIIDFLNTPTAIFQKMAVFVMGKFLFVALVFVTLCANADVFTADTVCTWTPWDVGYYDGAGNWYSECDGVQVTGVALCSAQSGSVGDVLMSQPVIDTSESRDENNIHCWCKMTAPYEGAWVYRGVHGTKEKYCDGSGLGVIKSEICSSNCAELWLVKNSGNAWLDNYRHGYYGTAEELVAIKAGLFTPRVTETPCEIGISKIVTSMGDSFLLYSEKYTERALVVQYNDQKCYGKIEEGHGRLNFKIGDDVYHLVE